MAKLFLINVEILLMPLISSILSISEKLRSSRFGSIATLAVHANSKSIWTDEKTSFITGTLALGTAVI